MKKYAPPVETSKTESIEKEKRLLQVQQHYKWWNDDNKIRATRPGGWDDVTRAYYGILPDDWPFTSRTTDPRIRTSLLEKNARLTSHRLRGKVVPREGSDMVKARINNSLVDFQWDAANDGGSMQTKVSICDLDARMYQTKFAYVPWLVKKDYKGQVVFEGNELRPLNIQDCGMDPNCDHIRNARWFQLREWKSIEDLKANAEMLPGLPKLLELIKADKRDDGKSDYVQGNRDIAWQDKLKQSRGLEDRMGKDNAFPVQEIVTEQREDCWIMFSPRYNVELAYFANPYDHRKIPIAQLRYYPSDGDNLGESEVESVLPMWKAIQATVCAYLDEVILKMRPPLKVVEGAARVETLIYQPEAQWLMDNVNAVMEMESRGDSIRYFQATYPALVSAFNVAMGDLSQGTSNVDPMAAEKTATEIRQVAKQQNTRDQKNQIELGEFIKDIVMMWISNNKQFLFKDEDKQEYVLRIIGSEAFEAYKALGMDEMILTQEAAEAVDRLRQQLTDAGQPPTEAQLNDMIEAAKTPKYPVEDTDQKGDGLYVKPKMRPEERGTSAELSIVPEDLDGLYDFIPEMKSMEASFGEQMMQSRNMALQLMMNPSMLSLLQMQGYKPAVKDLLVATLEDQGLNDASRFFEPIQPPTIPSPTPTGVVPPGGPVGPGQAGGPVPPQPTGGVAASPATPPPSPTLQ